MQVVPIKCPNCGANVYLEEGKVRGFCSNCGGQILIDDGIQRTIHIVQDKTKEYEIDAYMERRRTQLEQLNKEISKTKKNLITYVSVMFVLIVALLIGFYLRLFTPGDPLNLLLTVAAIIFGVLSIFKASDHSKAVEERNKFDAGGK